MTTLRDLLHDMIMDAVNARIDVMNEEDREEYIQESIDQLYMEYDRFLDRAN